MLLSGWPDTFWEMMGLELMCCSLQYQDFLYLCACYWNGRWNGERKYYGTSRLTIICCFAGSMFTAKRMPARQRSPSASTPLLRAVQLPAGWSWRSCTKRPKIPRRRFQTQIQHGSSINMLSDATCYNRLYETRTDEQWLWFSELMKFLSRSWRITTLLAA